MSSKKILTIINLITFLIFTGVIAWWHLYAPRDGLSIQSPGADNRPEGAARSIDDVLIGEYFLKYEDVAVSGLTGKWIRFRGEKSDNIIITPETLNTSGEEYPILWTVETGEGYAAPVIYNGKVYLLDYIETLSSDALRCFELETGKELWRRWYRVPMKRNHGFSRTTPVIGEGYIITIGPMAHVMCCDPITGNMIWTFDMQKKFGAKIPQWYAGQCPIVDNGILILAPASDSILLAGFNCQTGEILWTTPNTVNYTMSHSSVIPMTLDGKRMYVYVGIGGVCGVSAEKDDQGKLLWETSGWQPSVAVASPVKVANNRIFVCAGYGTGGAMLQIDRQGDRWTASVIQQHRANAGLSCEQHTPIFYNNMLITVVPKDGGPMRDRLAVYSPSNLNSPLWTSAADERFGLGPFIVINNHLFALKDDGELYVYEIMQQSMKLLKKQRIIDNGKDAFGPLAYADGILILGDAYTLKAVKIYN